MVEKLIRCTLCNKVIPVYPQFGDFDQQSELPGVEWSSKDLEAQKKFWQDHRGHTLEELTIDRGTIISDRPDYEPGKASFALAMAGKTKFLVIRIKAGYSEPAVYGIIHQFLQANS